MSPNYQVDSSSTPTREYSPLPVRARASRSVVECRRDSIHPPVKVDSPAGAQPLPPPSMSVSDVDRTGYPRNFSPTIRSSRRRGLRTFCRSRCVDIPLIMSRDSRSLIILLLPVVALPQQHFGTARRGRKQKVQPFGMVKGAEKRYPHGTSEHTDVIVIYLRKTALT